MMTSIKTVLTADIRPHIKRWLVALWRGAHSGPTISECGKRNNFHFIRWALACMVVAVHCLMINGFTPPGPGDWRDVFAGRWVGMFLVVSGYLITQSRASSGNAVDFFRKRILRIYPAFVVASAGAYFIGWLMADSRPDFTRTLFAHGPTWLGMKFLFLSTNDNLPTYSHSPRPGDINGPLWTVGYEFGIYLILAGLWGIRLFQRRWFVFCAFVIAYVLSFFPRDPQSAGIALSGTPIWFNWVILAQWTTFFLVGALAWYWREKILINPTLAVIATVLTIAVPIAGYGYVLYPITGAYVLLFVAFSPNIKLSWWGDRGDLSYGLYVWCWPIQQVIVCTIGQHLNYWWYLILSLAFGNIVAIASWHLIEKPFLRRKARKEIITKPEPVAALTV